MSRTCYSTINPWCRTGHGFMNPIIINMWYCINPRPTDSCWYMISPWGYALGFIIYHMKHEQFNVSYKCHVSMFVIIHNSLHGCRMQSISVQVRFQKKFSKTKESLLFFFSWVIWINMPAKPCDKVLQNSIFSFISWVINMPANPCLPDIFDNTI